MRSWSEDDLPSEKLLLKGKASLSDAELLSLIIGSGIQGNNSLDIAKKVLASSANNLSDLWRRSFTDLRQIEGIGKGKAVQILAMMELGRRRSESEVFAKAKISTSRDAYDILHAVLGDLPYEEFWMLILNKANKVIRKIKISEGGISGTVVDPKKIFKISLDFHASSIILGHNHPSGNLQPSEADIKITKKLKDSGILLDISVLDHLIIGDDRYYSFADEGAI